MAIDFQEWKKKREEGAESGSSSPSQYDRWKAWKASGDKSSSFALYEKKQKMLSGGLQPEDEAYNEWLDALSSYGDRAAADYKSRENQYQSRSDLGKYNIDAAAHMAQLRTGAEASRKYYTENRDLYDELYGADTVDKILSTIDSGNKYLDDIRTGLKSESDYWGQWDDRATYNLAMEAVKEQERQAQEQASFVSEESDGYKAYGNNWSRYVELSGKESLTKEEKSEAKTALKDMQSKYHVVNQGDVFATNMPKDMEKVYINLLNKSNWGAGVTAGFMDAFGVDWLMDKGAQALAAITGQEYSSEDSIQDQFAGIKAAHPGAYTGGNIAGNLAALLAGGKLVKAGSAAIPAMSKLAPVAQKAIQSGATFGLSGGYQALTNTVSKQEWDENEKAIQAQYAQQGIRYDPVDFNAWEQVGNVAAQAGISALGGAAGSFTSSFVGDLGKAFLVKKSLQTPFAEALRQTLSGTAFAAGNTASTYWLYPKESRPSKEKIAQDLAIAFLFSAVTSTISTMQTTKANKAYIENAVTKMKQDYQRTLNTNMTPAEQVAAFDDILAYNADIRAAISQNYYAGQQSYIDEILRGMDAIDEQIMIIKNGMAPGATGSYTGNANVPATVGGNTPSVYQQPVTPVQPPAGPLEPSAYPAVIAKALQLPPDSDAFKLASSIESGAMEATPESISELQTAIANTAPDLQQAAMEAATMQEIDTAEEPLDNVPDIDVAAVRKTLADRGIENGEIVDVEKFNNSPFTRQLNDLETSLSDNPTPAAETPSTDVATALNSIRESGAKNVPYESVLSSTADIVSSGAVTVQQVSAAYAEGLAEYNGKYAMEPKKTESGSMPTATTVDGSYISKVMSVNGRLTHDGLKFTVTGTASGFYVDIAKDDDGMISNARSKLYHGGPFATQQEAADDLAAVYETNFAKNPALVENDYEKETEYIDKRAVLRYKSAEAYVLNEKLLKKTDLTDFEKAWSEELSGALERMPDYEKPTYRTLVFDHAGKEAYNSFIGNLDNCMELGVPVTFDNFTSTTKTVDGYPMDGELKVFLHVDGIRGKDLRAYLHGVDDAEGEVLFNKGTSFIPIKKYVDNGIVNYEISEVFESENRKEPMDVSTGSKHEPVRGVQTLSPRPDGKSDADMQSVPERNTERDIQGGSGSLQGELSGGQRDAGRESVKPHERLAAVLADKLISKGITFNSSLLFEQADKAYGGTMASGAYTVKDAYDALELAVNKTLLSRAKNYNGNAVTAARAERVLQQLLDTLPTQTKRTEEQQSFQQFSTPPNIAYLAAWTANIANSDVVLEPSAGIGGLAVFPKAWGATVVANELSERRLAFLKSMGFDRVFNENAEQINNVLPDDVVPSVVIMNPPFSSTAGRTATNKTENATKHIEQALLRLQDGGRLVAILGRGMSNDSHTFSKWWDELRKKYDIRANISIDGSNYKKYGTTFDVQLVVIDKTGLQTGETITGTYKNLTEIPSALEGVRNDRKQIKAVSDTGIGNSASGNDTVARDGEHRSGSIERPVGNAPADGRKGAVQGNNAGSGALQQPADRTAVQQNADRKDGSGLRNEPAQPLGNVREQPERLPVDRPVAEPALSGLKPQRKKAVKSDNGIYAEYVPAELPIKGAIKHPAPLVESAAMSAVSAPAATYKPNLPPDLIKSGALSSAQLENIVYAGQAHAKMLPDGSRKGYFIGDGTGVGKGRQISGIILDNMRQGRKKAIWVSKNLNLLPDAQRDWADIGQNKDDVASQASFKIGSPIGMKNGILFTGYDTLRSGKGKDTRLQQIVDWAGKDFDGIIAFDEAHNMGNLLGKKGARGMTKGSAKAQAGVDLQNMLPNARIVYVSATGATDVNELAYAQRLGLWGRGTAFNDVNDFVSKIGSSGIAAMELVARDMKAMGSYLARSISYDGVTYDTLQHNLTPMQTEIYDTMSHAWQITMQNINEALNITNGNLNAAAKTAARSAYYGAMQRFYNQVLTSMSMPSVIEDIKKELADGHSCVLQIVNTNAAEQERQLAKIRDSGGDLDDMDLTPRGTLLGYLENSFPVYAYEEYTDEDGKMRSRIVTDRDGKPVVDKQAVAMRDKLIAQINEMSIPDGPLEMLFDAFSVDAVAEVTGRGRRIVPKTDEKGRTVRVEERRSKNHTEADIQAFQDGKKRILVFSDAGGTGKSYHADLRAKNQQQRIHYLVQPGWSASTATQGFGRSHRSNQATTPKFKLVTTNIMGQKRFVSTIARRLDQLGALTKGQRETGSGMFTEKDNLESTLSRDSLRLFYERLGRNRIDGIDGLSVLEKLGLKDKFTDEYGNFKIMDENAARDMNTFLNRILALEVDEQNTVFNEFYRIFESQYDKALEDGTLDRGMESVKADKIEIIDDKVIRTDEATGATTNYVQAKTYQKARLISTIKQLENLRSDFMGLYKTDSGDVRAVYRVADKTSASGKVNKMYRLQPPLMGKYSTWSESTLQERANKLEKGEWATAWKGEVAKAPDYDERTVHMLTGTLLPIWDRLPQEGNTRAMRITADDGTQYLGRVIPADQIDSVLRQLGADGRTRETFTAADVRKRVMAGETAKLTKDHQAIVRKRVSNEYRMEVTGKNLWYLPRNYSGIITEYISYEQRYFIPTGEKGDAILAALIKDNPVSEIYSGGDVDYAISTDTSKQSTSSAATSINSAKLPAVFSRVKFSPNTVNLDIGGGRFDNATDYLATQGVTSYIYDPYNRTQEHNAKSAAATQDGKSDTVTISNVLNVIKEPDARAEVLLNAVDAVKKGGTVYITVYEGNGSGKGAASSKGWQENRLTSSYLPEVKHYFSDVTVKNKVIAARNPQKQKLKVRQSGNKDFSVSASQPAAAWKAYRSVENNNPWSAQRVGSTDKKPMPISDIVSKIRHDFGIPVEKGRMPRRTVAGQYDRHSHSVQTRIVNDLPTVAHELGHHLDNVYGITKGLSKELTKELVDNLSDAMKASYPEKKLRTEGFAEYIRRYMQNRETAAIDYPLFSAHFESSIDPKDMELINSFADEINAYYSLDAETAQSSIREFGEGPRDFRTIGERAADTTDKAYQAWIDSFHGIKLFDRAAGTNTYIGAINSAYADSVAYSVLTRDLTDMNGKRVGDGLQQALKGINLKDPKEYKAFGEYLTVRHGPERLAEGMRIFADDRKNSTAWMNARQTVLEQQYPEFENAANRLYEFQKNFLQTWGVKTGLVPAKSAEQWAERWKYYVPFNRAIAKQSHIGAKRGFANQNSTIRKARGSGEDFYNPVDNIINNMVKMVNAAIRNNVMLSVREAALDNEGLSNFAERVPAPVKRTVYNVSSLKQSIEDQVTASDLTEGDASKVFGIIDGMDDILVQYERGKATGNEITVLVDGNPEYWKINDPLMLESLTNMSSNEVGAVLHALGTVSRFMTANITGLNLIWSIGSNTVRDLGTLLTFSKDKNPANIFAGIFRAYMNSLRKPDAQDPLYKEFLGMGGGSESAYTADKNMTKDVHAKLAGTKRKWLNPLEWIEAVSNIIERGPRYATYKMMRDNGMSPQQAIYESHDITVNFRRGGTTSRQVNKVVPFFNAGVQGADKLLRWITCEDVPKEGRAKAIRSRVMGYFAAFGVLGALQWFINSRDEDAKKYYAQLSTYTKNNFWCIPIYEDGKATGEYVTIPKPRELAIPASLVSTALEFGMSGNDDAFREFDDYALGSYLPNLADDVAKGIVGLSRGDMSFTDVASSLLGNLGIIGIASYMVSNRDFLGRPIESAYFQNLEPKDRYTGRTSKAAYAIGQAFNMSPIMIDYALQNFLGGFWKTQKALFPVDPQESDPTMGLASTYVRDSQYSTDLVNTMYDTRQAAYLAKNSDPDSIEKAIAYKESNNMTTFYSRFNKLDDGAEPLTRQIVLDMIYDFNKAAKSDYRSNLQSKVDALCENIGNTELMCGVMQNYIKDDTRHDLNAKQYVEFQGLYNSLYWQYVGAALNSSPASPEMAVRQANARAIEEAKGTMLSRIGAANDYVSELQQENAAGVTANDDILFNAALEAAGADGSLKKQEVIDALDSMDLTDEQKEYLFGTKAQYSGASNIYKTASQLNDWITVERSSGRDDKAIAQSITTVYKDLYIEYWLAGDQQGMNEIADKLIALDLRKKDLMPYYTYETFLGWIENYMK